MGSTFENQPVAISKIANFIKKDLFISLLFGLTHVKINFKYVSILFFGGIYHSFRGQHYVFLQG